MCKNAYEQLSEQTNTVMIFCKLKGNNATMSQLCISQRYCKDKNKYVPLNQKQSCKLYED